MRNKNGYGSWKVTYSSELITANPYIVRMVKCLGSATNVPPYVRVVLVKVFRAPFIAIL